MSTAYHVGGLHVPLVFPNADGGSPVMDGSDEWGMSTKTQFTSFYQTIKPVVLFEGDINGTGTVTFAFNVDPPTQTGAGGISLTNATSKVGPYEGVRQWNKIAAFDLLMFPTKGADTPSTPFAGTLTVSGSPAGHMVVPINADVRTHQFRLIRVGAIGSATTDTIILTATACNNMHYRFLYATDQNP